MHRPSPSRGAAPRSYVRLALTAALAASVIAALPAAGATAAPAKPAHRLTPPKAHSPKKPKRSFIRKHRAPMARASLCSAPMIGDWHNINASTNAMTRALVSFTCNDVILCDTSGHCTGGDSYYAMHPFGRCHPTDCDWGRLRAYDMGGGWIESTYNFGFASVYVWLKTYDYYGLTYLRVWTYTDFTPADGRTDYTSDEWMLR